MLDSKSLSINCSISLRAVINLRFDGLDIHSIPLNRAHIDGVIFGMGSDKPGIGGSHWRVEEDLEYEVEVGQGGVTAHKESMPDERADASQDNTQLIDVRVGLLLFHEQSV